MSKNLSFISLLTVMTDWGNPRWVNAGNANLPVLRKNPKPNQSYQYTLPAVDLSYLNTEN